MSGSRERCRACALAVCWLATLASSGVLVPCAAARVPELVRAVLDSAPVAPEERCSYTRTRMEGEASKRERYHAGPADQARWSLERVDGRAPTDAELRRYARGAGSRDRRHPLAFDLRSMVDGDRWRLRSETPAEAAFEFRLRPSRKLDRRIADKVLGTLVIDKTRQQPVRVGLENTAPAYVAPFVRVSSYRQDMRFRWDGAVGSAVLVRAETEWHGRAFGIKALGQHEVVLYSDYRCRPLP